MKLRWTIIIAAAFLVAAFVAIAGSGPARAGNSTGGKIAYMSLWDGQADIYSMDAYGKGQFNITDDKTIGQRTDVEPAWSPDGSRVAFERQSSKGGAAIMIVRADGTKLRTLTISPSLKVSNCHPSWTPDGAGIVFTSNRDGNFDLYAIKASGRGLTQLTFTEAPVQNLEPQWSPDGASILFSRTGSSGKASPAGLYLLKTATGDVVRLTETFKRVGDVSPMWSSNSQLIAFSSDRMGSNDIYVMKADGSGLTQLTKRFSNDNHPTFSPDGTTLAFVSDRTGATEIFALSLATMQLNQLTSDNAFKSNPTWQ